MSKDTAYTSHLVQGSDTLDSLALKYYNKALKQSKNKEIEYTLLGTIYYNIEDFDLVEDIDLEKNKKWCFSPLFRYFFA